MCFGFSMCPQHYPSMIAQSGDKPYNSSLPLDEIISLCQWSRRFVLTGPLSPEELCLAGYSKINTWQQHNHRATNLCQQTKCRWLCSFQLHVCGEQSIPCVLTFICTYSITTLYSSALGSLKNTLKEFLLYYTFNYTKTQGFL